MTFKLIFLTVISMASMAEISNLNALTLDKSDTVVVDQRQFSHTKALDKKNPYTGGFNDLLSFVVPSPYQGAAGSCLYMSHTGVIEWWLNKLENRTTDKNKIDLSERYYMSLKTDDVNDSKVDNWRTDNIQRLNAESIMYKNSQYRFTMGHYKVVDGQRVSTNSEDEDAIYGMKYNWISYRDQLSKKNVIKLPKFKRIVYHADPDYNQWKVAEAPKDIVATVKSALLKYRSPVQVIYNHKGFWHAVFIAGFNDQAETKCPFIDTFKSDMYARADEIEQEAQDATTASRRNSLMRKAKKFRIRGDKVEKRYVENGRCRGKGVFYVRDSIYPNEDMPIYDYDFSNEGEEKHLNAEIILREYEWLENTANHVFQVLPIL